MSVTIARGLRSAIRKNPGSIMLQVQKSGDADAAFVAVQRAAVEIAALDAGWESGDGLGPEDRNGPKWVWGPHQTGSGPFLMVDGGDVPQSLLQTIPDILVRHLESMDITNGIVASPGDYVMGYLNWLEKAVILQLFTPPPPPGERLRRRHLAPAEWIAALAPWLCEGVAEGLDVWAAMAMVNFPLPATEVAAFLERARSAGGTIVVGAPPNFSAAPKAYQPDPMMAQFARRRLGGRVRGFTANTIGFERRVTIAAGGPDVSDGEMLAIVDSFRKLARGLADTVAYSFVTTWGSFDRFAANLDTPWWIKPYATWPADEDVRASAALGRAVGSISTICDEVVMDGFPFQVLGPGHLQRLTRGGSVPSDLRPLPGGRMELTVGQPASWLPHSPELPGVQEQARKILTPCILAPEEWWPTVEARRQPHK